MLPFRSKKYQEKMCKPALETEEAASQWILRREQLRNTGLRWNY